MEKCWYFFWFSGEWQNDSFVEEFQLSAEKNVPFDILFPKEVFLSLFFI